MVRGGRGSGQGALVAEEGERALGTPVREVAVLAALHDESQSKCAYSTGLFSSAFTLLFVDRVL